MHVYAVDKSDITPLKMPDRFRLEIPYFMETAGSPGVPKLGKGKYWVDLQKAQTWLDDMVISVVSPLSAEVKAEVELSEDHERWLEWMLQHQIQHVRLVAE